MSDIQRLQERGDFLGQGAAFFLLLNSVWTESVTTSYLSCVTWGLCSSAVAVINALTEAIQKRKASFPLTTEGTACRGGDVTAVRAGSSSSPCVHS